MESKIAEAFRAGLAFGKAAHRIEANTATEQERPFKLFAVDEPTADILSIEQFRRPFSSRGSVA